MADRRVPPCGFALRGGRPAGTMVLALVVALVMRTTLASQAASAPGAPEFQCNCSEVEEKVVFSDEPGRPPIGLSDVSDPSCVIPCRLVDLGVSMGPYDLVDIQETCVIGAAPNPNDTFVFFDEKLADDCRTPPSVLSGPSCGEGMSCNFSMSLCDMNTWPQYCLPDPECSVRLLLGSVCGLKTNEHQPTMCEEGSYCPHRIRHNTTAFESEGCPEGSYCPLGTAGPIECDVLEYCSAGLAAPSQIVLLGIVCLGDVVLALYLWFRVKRQRTRQRKLVASSVDENHGDADEEGEPLAPTRRRHVASPLFMALTHDETADLVYSSTTAIQRQMDEERRQRTSLFSRPSDLTEDARMSFLYFTPQTSASDPHQTAFEERGAALLAESAVRSLRLSRSKRKGEAKLDDVEAPAPSGIPHMLLAPSLKRPSSPFPGSTPLRASMSSDAQRSPLSSAGGGGPASPMSTSSTGSCLELGAGLSDGCEHLRRSTTSVLAPGALPRTLGDRRPRSRSLPILQQSLLPHVYVPTRLDAQDPESAYRIALQKLSLGFVRARGCVFSLTFQFQNLGMTLPSGKRILQSVSGSIEPAKVTAIMGPSGAGKTTFLNVLMDKVPPYLERSGDLRINGAKLSTSHFKKAIGYVPQDDIMHRSLTVRDNIAYSAAIRAPRRWSSLELRAHIDAMLRVLDLYHVQHSIIGDEETRGVSGGQRKRVNIGMEIVACPVALFLDEPTSGLDSTSALSVMQALKDISRSTGITVAMVVHQPRREIWDALDQLLLLGPGGRTVYQGAQNHVDSWFREALDIAPSTLDNPADFYMDVIAKEGQRCVEAWNRLRKYEPLDDEVVAEGEESVSTRLRQLQYRHSCLGDVHYFVMDSLTEILRVLLLVLGVCCCRWGSNGLGSDAEGGEAPRKSVPLSNLHPATTEVSGANSSEAVSRASGSEPGTSRDSGSIPDSEDSAVPPHVRLASVEGLEEAQSRGVAGGSKTPPALIRLARNPSAKKLRSQATFIGLEVSAELRARTAEGNLVGIADVADILRKYGACGNVKEQAEFMVRLNAKAGTDVVDAEDIDGMCSQMSRRRTGATWVAQFVHAHQRALRLWFASPKAVAIELAIVLIAGVVIGFASTASFRGILREPYTLLSPSTDEGILPLAGMLIIIGSGICAVPAGVKLFGGEKVIYWREASVGHSPSAYFGGVSLASTYRVALAAVHFAATFGAVSAADLTSSMQLVHLTLLCFYCMHGLSNLVSMLLPFEGAMLVSVVLSLLVPIVGGLIPSIPVYIQNFSFGRFINEALFSLGTVNYRHLFIVEEFSEGYRFVLDRVSYDKVIALIHGFVFRCLAFIAMVRLNSNKQR